MSKRKHKDRVVEKALRRGGFKARGGKLVHSRSGITVTASVVGGDQSKPFSEQVKDRLDELGVPHRDVEITATDKGAKTSRGTQQSFGFDTTHGFLGEEFLLWLWWKFETDGGEFTLPGGRVVGVAFDDLIVFAPSGDDETRQTLKDGLPTRTAEARTALRQGHRLARAKLLLAEGDRQWTATLDGTAMTCGAVKLPDDAEECESASDRTTDRAANWLHLHELVSTLFGVFVKQRVAATWLTKEARAIGTWMQS